MKYATPYKYAQLCGVSRQAIYQRIASGTLKTESFTNPLTSEVIAVINLKTYPPTKGKTKDEIPIMKIKKLKN